MKQEEKQLLLKDLCDRLPYGVQIHYHWSREGNTIDENRELDFSDVETLKYNIENPQNDWCEISWKPYLRLLSSMTEEEKEEYRKVCELDTKILSKHPMDETPFPALYNSQDWLNANHFDYRGLIEKNLALEAPKDMYKTE